MHERTSIEAVTAEIIEASMDRDAHEVSEDEDEVLKSDTWAEHARFREEVMGSVRLRSAMIVMAATMKSEKFSLDNPPTVDAALEMYRVGEISDWQVELAISACREWFFNGWHSRGAVDEAGLLQWLIHGRDRRGRQESQVSSR